MIGSRPPCSNISTLQENSATEKKILKINKSYKQSRAAANSCFETFLYTAEFLKHEFIKADKNYYSVIYSLKYCLTNISTPSKQV